MGQSPEELKGQIEATRSDLGETLDAIGDRVSPGRMIQRRTNRVREGVQRVRDGVMGVAQGTLDTAQDRLDGAADNVRSVPDAARRRTQGAPLVMGAVAFGVGVLIAALLPRTEAEEQAADALAEKVEPLKQELLQSGRDTAEHLKEPVREALAEVKDTAAQGAQQVTEQARDGAQQTASAAQQVSGNGPG